MPDDLEDDIREALEEDPTRPWDAVLAEIVEAQIEKGKKLPPEPEGISMLFPATRTSHFLPNGEISAGK